MENRFLEIILHNYNALLAIIFGLSAWYVGVESILLTSIRSRRLVGIILLCLGTLNVANGVAKMFGVSLVTEGSLLLFLPMAIMFVRLGLNFRKERLTTHPQDNKIDISLKVGAVRTDKNLTILWASKGIEQITSYNAEELVGQTWAQFLHPDSLHDWHRFKTAIGHGNLPFDLELAIVDRHGITCWIQLANNREFTHGGEFTSIITGIKNITDRKRFEVEATLLQAALHSLPVGITISGLDEHRTIRYINHTEAVLHGYRHEELVGKSVRMLTPKALWPLFQHHLTLELLDGLDRETLNVRKNGDFLPIRLQTAIVYDTQQKPQALVSMSEALIETGHGRKTLYPEGSYLPIHFQTFFQGRTNQQVLMMYFGRDREVIVCNRAVEHSMGYTLAELQEDTGRICATPEDLERALAFVFTPTRQLIPLSIRTKAGKIKPQCWLGFHAIHGTLAVGYDCTQKEFDTLCQKFQHMS